MGTVVVLKEVEKTNPFNTDLIQSYQQAAVFLDFNQKFQQSIQFKKISEWASDGLEVLRVIQADYEKLMQELAKEITPEQLAEVTALSAQDQINEDLRRLRDLLQALSDKVLVKKGVSLLEAFEAIKKDISHEVGSVAAYLEKSEYPLFQVMMKVIGWASVESGEIDKNEINHVIQCLLQLGAYDAASALVFLNSRL